MEDLAGRKSFWNEPFSVIDEMLMECKDRYIIDLLENSGRIHWSVDILSEKKKATKLHY